MRTLMKCTVGTAVEIGLVDLAVQAVDGTKIPGNASTDRAYNAVTLQKLLDRTEAAIAKLRHRMRVEMILLHRVYLSS